MADANAVTTKVDGRTVRGEGKAPFGHKFCKNPACGKLIRGLRTQVCPHCQAQQPSKAKPKKSPKATKVSGRDPGRPPKVQATANLNVVPVTPTVPDPFTFTVETPHARPTAPRVKGMGKFYTHIERGTADLAGLNTLSRPDKDGVRRVMVPDDKFDGTVDKAMDYAVNIELPDHFDPETGEYFDTTLEKDVPNLVLTV